jgi:hypothetical protein
MSVSPASVRFLIRVHAAAVNPTDVVMWRTLGGGSVADKTSFSVELARVLADEADGGTVFVAQAAVRDAGSKGARAR